MIGTCEYCHKENEDLRPYGRHGANICFTCGSNPMNEAETRKNFGKLLRELEEEAEGVGDTIILGDGTPHLMQSNRNN